MENSLAGLATGLVLVAMVATGCGAAQEQASQKAQEKTQPTTMPTATKPTAMASRTPTPTPTPTRSPRPTRPALVAADGMRYDECADGRCEVEVSRPTRIRVDHGGVLEVTEVKADGFAYELTLSYGEAGAGTLEGTDGPIGLFFPDNVAVISCEPPDAPCESPDPMAGVFQLQFVGMNGEAAVIRVVSGGVY